MNRASSLTRDPVVWWIERHVDGNERDYEVAEFDLPFGPLEVRSNWPPLFDRLRETFVPMEDGWCVGRKKVTVEVTYVQRSHGVHGLALPAEWLPPLDAVGADERRTVEELRHLMVSDTQCLWRPADLLVSFSDHSTDPSRILFDVRRTGRTPLRSTAHRPTTEHGVTIGEIIDLVRALYLYRHDCFCLHAAAVALEGRGALVLGPSGGGKSTTALSLAKAGAQLLSDELVILPSSHRDRVTVRGLFVPPRICGPEMQNLDALEERLGPHSPSKGIAGGFSREERLRADRTEVAPAALFFLDGFGSSGEHVLEPLPAAEAFARIMAQLIDPMWSTRKQGVFEAVTTLAESCPSYRLQPGTDLGSLAELLLDTIEASQRVP